MGTEPDDAEGDDDADEVDEPRVRPLRLILGSVFALIGLVGVVLGAAAVLSPWPTAANSQGEISVILAPLARAFMAIVLLVSLVLLLAGGATAITTLLEARAARRLADARQRDAG